MVSTIAPPMAIIPPFILPNRDGTPVNTARLRGRRYAVLLFLSPDDPDASAYLATYAAEMEQFAWLHTEVITIIPADTPADPLPALPFPVLRDDGRVRARILPDMAPGIAALFVTDLDGRVTEWRTARRVSSLPDVAMALAWAWDVARPRGSCGGVTWTPVANPMPPPPPPTPIGRYTIGTTRRPAYRRGAPPSD
jgi:peroxiredoxin